MNIRLTDKLVATSKLPEDKDDIIIWDDRLTGFGLRPSAAARQWR